MVLFKKNVFAPFRGPVLIFQKYPELYKCQGHDSEPRGGTIMSPLQGWLLLAASKSCGVLICAIQNFRVCKLGSGLFAHADNFSLSTSCLFSPGAEVILLDGEFLPNLMLNALSVPLVL